MDHFQHKNGELYCEDVPASTLAEVYGTPLYVYSRATLLRHYQQVAEAFAPVDPTVCYSIKSNGNLSLCRLLVEAGCGMDVTSGGELFRALRAGVDPKRVIFAGVGKTDAEIQQALTAGGEGIAAFNVESEAEIENLARVAQAADTVATAALRVNPDVDPDTHAYTTTGKKETKFGVDLDRAEAVFDKYRDLPGIRLAGLHMHLGSPIYSVEPYVLATQKINATIDRLREQGHAVEWFDIGGGFGVNYEHPDQALPVSDFADALVPLLKDRGYKVAIEPGRYIAGNAGVLLGRVLYRKTSGSKSFVISDVGMNDLLRPSLYGAYHFIWPTAGDGPASRDKDVAIPDGETVDVVGPVCETGDFVARGRLLPKTERGDLIAIYTAGAYAFSMASNYNNRPRPAEVLVDGDRHTLVRRRETYEDLVALETGVG
ncbi:MAG: diaminopimelate decarboxylase [Planctomycetota bacterium]